MMISTSTRTYASRLGLLALALAAALAGPGHAQERDVKRSPAGDKSVTVEQGPHGLQATYAWPGGKLDATQGVPFPGAVAVKWIDDQIAQVGGPCGPGCNAVFLVSPKGVVGPFPYVLAVDLKARVFAASDATTIVIQSLDPPSRVLAQRPAPEWCKALDCAFKARFVGGSLNFTGHGHTLSVPFH
jgi:hypothetical protein